MKYLILFIFSINAFSQTNEKLVEDVNSVFENLNTTKQPLICNKADAPKKWDFLNMDGCKSNPFKQEIKLIKLTDENILKKKYDIHYISLKTKLDDDNEKLEIEKKLKKLNARIRYKFKDIHYLELDITLENLNEINLLDSDHTISDHLDLQLVAH